MKRTLLLVVTMCMVSWFASAQALAARPAQASSDEETLKQIEHDWDTASTKADTAALDRILAADWVVTNPEGQIETKAQRLAALKSGERKVETATTNDNDMKVRLFGDVAIVHGLSTVKSSSKGKDISGRYRWTDVFAKRGGRWQAVSTQSTRVATP